MSTILKDADSSVGSLPAAPQTLPQAAEPQPKPQPVALEVSVTVNGARTVEGSDKREPFSESTKTVLVFGHGAVIRLQSSVAPGQLLFLTNEKTKKEVVCQVVKSKNYRSVSGYVELEFTESVLGFWGMRFPGDRLAPSVAAPAPHAAAPASATPVSPSPVSPSLVSHAPVVLPAFVPPASSPVQSLPPSISNSRKPSPQISPGVNASVPAVIAAVPVSTASATPGVPLTAPISKSSPSPAPPAPAPVAASSVTPVVRVAPVAPASPSAKTAPVVPFLPRPDVSVSSTASSSVRSLSSVLSLPHASDAKPTPPAPVASALTAANSTPEDPTAALRAENARLQQQLTSLLFPKSQNSAPLPGQTTEVPAKVTGETAAKILEMAHADLFVATPPVPASVQTLANDPTPAKPVSPAALPASPRIVAPQPPAPAKTASAPLPSLLEHEPLQIPAWLEPLARNSANSTPASHASAESSSSILDQELNAAAALTPLPTVQNAGGSHSASPASGLASSSPFASEIPDILEAVIQHSADQAVGTSDLALEEESLSSASFRPDESAGETPLDLPEPNFGSGLRIDDSSSGDAPRSHKALLLAIAAAMLLAAMGGLWYTGQAASLVSALQGFVSANATPAAPSETSSEASTPAPQHSALSSAPSSAGFATPSANAVANTSPGAIIKDKGATPAPLSANLVVSTNRSNAPNSAPPLAVQPTASPKRPSLGDVRLASPTVARRAGDDVSVSESDLTLNSSSAAAELPASANFASNSGPVAPSVPIPVGGDVKTAQLLKSVPPIYPSFAKTQRISGDVKIDALIDANGKVTTMKVVSGPAILHQAAMDALRQWHYQPATLDGNPIAMHLTVTVQFHIQ
jgi:protein TonB